MSISFEHIDEDLSNKAAEERQDDKNTAGAWHRDAVDYKDMGIKQTQLPSKRRRPHYARPPLQELTPPSRLPVEETLEIADVVPIHINVLDVLEAARTYSEQRKALLAPDPNFQEVDGEITPEYTGLNAPVYYRPIGSLDELNAESREPEQNELVFPDSPRDL